MGFWDSLKNAAVAFDEAGRIQAQKYTLDELCTHINSEGVMDSTFSYYNIHELCERLQTLDIEVLFDYYDEYREYRVQTVASCFRDEIISQLKKANNRTLMKYYKHFRREDDTDMSEPLHRELVKRGCL